MPSSIPTLDDQFPTLRGDESPREMFTAIVNYLFVLKESLDYTLANLSVDNWNSTALAEMTDDMTEETKGAIETQLEKLLKQLQSVAATVAQQTISVNDLTRDMGSTKDRVTALETHTDRVDSDITYLIEQVTELTTRLEKIEGVIRLEEEPETVTIGKENTPLRLVGQVSINGVPYEEGEV